MFAESWLCRDWPFFSKGWPLAISISSSCPTSLCTNARCLGSTAQQMLVAYHQSLSCSRFPTRFMEVVEDTLTGPSEDLMFLVLWSSGNGNQGANKSESEDQVASIVDTQPTVRIYLMILVVTQKKICQKMMYHDWSICWIRILPNSIFFGGLL